MNILALYRNLKVQDREHVILFRHERDIEFAIQTTEKILSTLRSIR